jgi:hypothetical protein
MASANNNQVVVADPTKSRWVVPVLDAYSNKEIGRNSYLNPGTMSNDVALEKAVPTSMLHFDRGSLVFRAEAQNLANHNNVGLVDVNLLDAGSPSFLNTQNARQSAGRQLRFWAKFVF